MAKKMLIDATHAEETRVVVVDGNKVAEFDFESQNKHQLAGNIYLAKVTRVEPSLQSAFVDYGGNRHGFLAFPEIHPDYYQIPVADREKLLLEEAEYVRRQAEEEAQREATAEKPISRHPQQSSKVADAHLDEVFQSDVTDLDEPDTRIVNVPEDRAGDTPAGAEAAVEAVEVEGEEDDARSEARVRKPRVRSYKIQEVIKVRQILLVQVVKEERGNKGVALTTYLSLAGRYCVLMPNTARGGGVSRKITSTTDRKKLKEIACDIEVPEGAGLIIRTAGAKRTKTEIKRDYEYLLRQWEQIRDLTLKSIAPAKIYEEGNLIKRSIRDLYNRDIDEILVEGEAGYREAKDYMKMLMPSHAVRVKHYTDTMPLYTRHQVEGYLDAMFNPTVHLKSGGYIVIGITEALVAIDVNSGKATREGSIEETALRTNLEAAEEVAHQLKLRDLAGLIVVDFIDMEERRNNSAVEKRIKEALKNDRARIQIGRISTFGLMEMSRQRLRLGMLEATTRPCPACHGTGIVRSDDSHALSILRELEQEGTRKKSQEVMVTAPVGVANYLLNEKREHIAMIEMRYGLLIRINADPTLISPDYKIEKFIISSRPVPKPGPRTITIDTVEPVEAGEVPQKVEEPEEDRTKKRRRRRGSGDRRTQQGSSTETSDANAADEPNDGDTSAVTKDGAGCAVTADDTPTEGKPKRKSRHRRSSKKSDEAEVKDEAAGADSEVVAETEEKPGKARRKRGSRGSRSKKARAANGVKSVSGTEDAPEENPKIQLRGKKDNAPGTVSAAAAPTSEYPASAHNPEPAVGEALADPTPVPKDLPNPKRHGWWSRG
ncbi:MAG: ribonuclease E/G [Rhodobacteraceae bacterium]|nr:ribonuclease E/G [Paracoccaceae bacterium]